MIYFRDKHEPRNYELNLCRTWKNNEINMRFSYVRHDKLPHSNEIFPK